MDKYDIQKLRDLPIESVAERLGLEVKKHKCLCPFHNDSHPSLTFNVAKNNFRCFVCDAHGDNIDLAMKVLNMPFLEACKWLAEDSGVVIRDDEERRRKIEVEKSRRSYKLDVEYLTSLIRYPTLNEPARHFLFDERKIDQRVVKWLGISSISNPTPCWRYGRNFYDAPSLLIPYKNIEGKLQSVQSRYLGASVGKNSDKGSKQEIRQEIPRFRFPKGSHCNIFNLPVLKLIKPGEDLYITEGVSDCMAMLSAGHKAIAIPSATLLNRDDKKLLAEFINSRKSSVSGKTEGISFHMYPDQDIPGEKLFLELCSVANEIGALMVRHSLPAGFKDFGAYWASQN